MSNRLLNLIYKVTGVPKANTEIASATSTIENMATSVAELEQIATGATGEGGASGGGIQGITGALLDMISPTDIAVGVVTKLSLAVKSGAEDWIDYAIEVGDLADTLQLTTEDANDLLGIMERYGITNEAITTAFKNMAKEGLDPTLKNLQLLLEEYDRITDSAEKMTFAQTKFGDQGLRQLIPMWERLTEAEKQHFDEVERGIEITDENIEAARGAEEAQLALDDAFKKIGGTLVQYWFDSTLV